MMAHKAPLFLKAYWLNRESYRVQVIEFKLRTHELMCLTSEWSAIEKEMGDGLQSAGHHMDT